MFLCLNQSMADSTAVKKLICWEYDLVLEHVQFILKLSSSSASPQGILMATVCSQSRGIEVPSSFGEKKNPKESKISSSKIRPPDKEEEPQIVCILPSPKSNNTEGEGEKK